MTMAELVDSPGLPRWLSVTGQPLGSSLDASFEGLSRSCHHPLHTHADSAAGQCLSVNAFEKLNQLGEGSRFGLGFEPQ